MRPVTLLRPYPPSHTLRAMARARHSEAVARLLAGDRDAWWSMLRDVRDLEEQADRALVWELECGAVRCGADWILNRATEGQQ